jgi:hypothetical protein
MRYRKRALIYALLMVGTPALAFAQGGGLVSVGSNNGNGNGANVSNRGVSSSPVSVGSNNGNGNGSQVSNTGGRTSGSLVSVGSNNGNGNGDAVSNKPAASGSTGSGAPASAPANNCAAAIFNGSATGSSTTSC